MVETPHQVIAMCRDELSANPIGYLSLSARRKLWLSYGPLVTDDSFLASGRVTAAHRSRAELAIRSCERILPVFDMEKAKADKSSINLVNSEDEPRHTLIIARARLRGEIDWETTKERADDLANLNQYMGELNEYPDAILVLEAAMTALFAVCLDIDWGDQSTDESELDFWGAEVYALWAETGERPWSAPAGPALEKARRAFWLWYLDQAELIANQP